MTRDLHEPEGPISREGFVVKGDAEIGLPHLVWSRALTAEELQQVHEWLVETYGVGIPNQVAAATGQP